MKEFYEAPMPKSPRLKLVRGLYSGRWILALCADGYPQYFARYEKGEDALKAIISVVDTGVFMGYPVNTFLEGQTCVTKETPNPFDIRQDLRLFN